MLKRFSYLQMNSWFQSHKLLYNQTQFGAFYEDLNHSLSFFTLHQIHDR